MKVKKINQQIINILNEEGEMTTDEIYNFVNRLYHHGCTMNQLSNVLAKAKEIQKVGWVDYTLHGFRRRSIVWSLKEELV